MTKDFALYITSAAAIGICAFICEQAATSAGSNKGLMQGMKLVTSLCIFIAVLYPVFPLLNHGRMLSLNTQSVKTEKSENDVTLFMEMVAADLEDKLNKRILDETGIPLQYIGIELTEDDKSIRIKSISAGILKRDSHMKNEILEIIGEIAERDTEILVSVLQE